MIDLVPDELQLEVVAVAKRALAPLASTRTADVSDAAWRSLADVGLFGIAAPEADGGAGLGVAGAALVAEAAGAALAPIGVLATIAVATAREAGADLLDGGARAAVGVRRTGDSWADAWTVVDFAADGVVLLLEADAVVAADAVIDVEQLASLDEGAAVSRVRIDPAVVDEARRAPAQRASTLARLLIAAAAVGVSGEALDRATAYASTRQQFGKPIGSFQAVKHRCVDMATMHGAALASVRFAAVRADAGIDGEVAVATALYTASDAARRNAASAIQVFGGIGFTAENGLQHLLNRAWLLQLLLGPPAVHEEALLRALGGSTGATGEVEEAS